MHSGRKASESILSVGLVQHYRQKQAFYRGFTLALMSHDDNRRNHSKITPYK